MLSRRPRKGLWSPAGIVPSVGKAWVKARRHDRFYRAAKKQSYRSRAAIKLSQIDLRYGLFEVGDVVVDLGAAPGGWSQLARERIGPKGRVIAVDLSPVSPIEGVEILRGDFQRPDPSRVVRDPPQARGRRHERHGPETERQPVARCGSDPRPGECGALLCGSRVAPQGPVPGEGVPR